MSRVGELTRRHRLAVELAGLAVALAAGLGIGAVLWGGGSTPTAGPVPTSTTAPTAPAAAHRRHGVRGQIAGEKGNVWTVTTLAGRTVTVLLTPATTFGTVNDPATRSEFTVGSSVTVVGDRTGSTITATRVFTLRQARSRSTTTSTVASATATAAASATAEVTTTADVGTPDPGTSVR